MCTSSEHGTAQIFFWSRLAGWDRLTSESYETTSRTGWVTEQNSPLKILKEAFELNTNEKTGAANEKIDLKILKQ